MSVVQDEYFDRQLTLVESMSIAMPGINVAAQRMLRNAKLITAKINFGTLMTQLFLINIHGDILVHRESAHDTANPISY